MTEPKRTSLILIAIWIVILLIAAFDVHADDCRGNKPCTDTILSGGDNTATNSAVISGSRSYGLSGSLGDVDINDCLASTQWGIVVFQKQKLVENQWCQAIYLDAIGAYEAAAKVRCTTKTLKVIYPDSKECEEAVTLKFKAENFNDESEVKGDEDDGHTDDIEALYARLIDLEAQRQTDTDNARKAAIRANTAAREAEQAEVSRKEYAQQMYEELKEWN